MKTTFHVVCVAAYLLLTIIPAIYGVHMYVLLYLSARKASRVRARQRRTIRTYQRQTPEGQWPLVTTQIPLYNEMAVARRVIEAAARMDYPAGRHEIQVLDDSNDGTCAIVDEICGELRARGVNIRAVRRPTREHFKAGALAHGLTTASGEFVAIFDADFVPNPSFLRALIPLIATCPDAGCVQGRWGHLNADECWMTEALALGIDGHFGVEQGARGWNNLLLNFNGTAGVWRRSAIEDARVGGWQGDTLTEDLDLSYRAQLAGWKVVYCVDEVCPAEVPADVNAIKTQQRRWAMGSIQTARKLLPAVWRSDLSLFQKIEASIHLTQYSVALFMVLLPLLARPLIMLIPRDGYTDWLLGGWLLVLLSCAAPSIAYVYARWALGGGLTGIGRILKLIVLGLGLSVNNCAAVIVGAIRRGGEFIRTPKTGSQTGARRGTSYAALRSNLWIYELVLGTFCFVQWLYFLRADSYFFGSFLLLYAIGLIYFGWNSRPASLMPAARPTAG